MRARVHLTAEDDGLSVAWHGTVFVNPPYGRGLAAWVAKARREVEEGRARTVVALLPARPDTAYWHEHVAGRAVVYFLRGRLRFGDGGQSAPFPSALAVWGASPRRWRPSTRRCSGPGGRGDPAGSEPVFLRPWGRKTQRNASSNQMWILKNSSAE